MMELLKKLWIFVKTSLNTIFLPLIILIVVAVSLIVLGFFLLDRCLRLFKKLFELVRGVYSGLP